MPGWRGAGSAQPQGMREVGGKNRATPDRNRGLPILLGPRRAKSPLTAERRCPNIVFNSWEKSPPGRNRPKMEAANEDRPHHIRGPAWLRRFRPG